MSNGPDELAAFLDARVQENPDEPGADNIRKLVAKYRDLDRRLTQAWQTQRDLTEGWPALPTDGEQIQPSDEGRRYDLIRQMREAGVKFAGHPSYDPAMWAP